MAFRRHRGSEARGGEKQRASCCNSPAPRPREGWPVRCCCVGQRPEANREAEALPEPRKSGYARHMRCLSGGGSGYTRQSRCLSREGGGYARQSRCLSRKGGECARQRRCLSGGGSGCAGPRRRLTRWARVSRSASASSPSNRSTSPPSPTCQRAVKGGDPRCPKAVIRAAQRQ